MIWSLWGSQVCLYLQSCGYGGFRIFEGGFSNEVFVGDFAACGYLVFLNG